MILGFTGTRHAPTEAQLTWLRPHFEDGQIEEFHHGACVGADACAHVFALLYGVPTVVHPPEDTKLIDMKASMPRSLLVKVMPAKPYHDRNRDIVDAADQMLALPDGPERPNGGTWYTVRYAMKAGTPVTICYPDGTVEDRPSLT